jgi:hypothetical protein
VGVEPPVDGGVVLDAPPGVVDPEPPLKAIVTVAALRQSLAALNGAK